jgi:hypothetical protein
LPDAFAGCVKDCIRNRGSNAYIRNLADTFRAEWIDVLVAG